MGQVLGGLLVNANLFGSQWRPVFLVNVPIGLAVLCLAPRVVPRDAPAGGRRLDLAGLAIAGPAVFAIALPLMLGHQEGWPAWILACIAAGIVLAAVFVLVERRIAGRDGDPLLNLRVLRAPGLVSGLAAVAILMVSYGGFLFTLALQLQDGLGESALRAGLTFAPSALAFGLCGFYWGRLPARVHHLLTPAGCVVAMAAYAALGLDLASGSRGGPLLPVILVVLGGSLALAFSPLVTHAPRHVPVLEAADASGLFTTTVQLGQAIGVAVFGSVFLALAAHPAPHASGHALATTLYWLAALLAIATLAALPLARTTGKAPAV